MKICYLVPKISVPGSNGGATHAFESAKALAEQGIEVHMISKREKGQKEYEQMKNLHIYRLSFPGYTIKNKANPALTIPLGFLKGFKIWEKNKFDLILERLEFTSGAGTLLKKTTKRPLVIEINSPHVEEWIYRGLPQNVGKLFKILENWQLRNADLLFGPLNTIVAPPYRDKFKEIEWGVNTELFKPLKKKPNKIALFIGAMSLWHGVEDILKAAEKYPEITFVLIGEGPLYKTLKEKSRHLKNVQWLGKIPYEKVKEHIASAGVCLAPFTDRKYEPLQRFGFYWSPIKLFEYMSMGKPIITTTLAQRIIKHNKNGYVIPQNNPEKLGEAVKELLDNPTKCKKLGEQARKDAENKYSWTQHAKKLIGYFEEVINE